MYKEKKNLKFSEFSWGRGEFGILKCASVSVDHQSPPTLSSFVLFPLPSPVFKLALILQFTRRLSCVSLFYIFRNHFYFSHSRIHSVPLCWLGYGLGPQRAEGLIALLGKCKVELNLSWPDLHMLKTATVSRWRLAAGNKDLCCVFRRPFCSSFPAGEIRVWDVLGCRCRSPPKYCGRHSELFLSASVLMKTYKGGYVVALIKWRRGSSWVDRCVCSLSLPQWGLAQQAKFFSPQSFLGVFCTQSLFRFDSLKRFCTFCFENIKVVLMQAW